MRRHSVTLLLAIALAACAGGSAGANASSADLGGTRRASNLIAADEIADASAASSAYDLVQRLRPNFLRSRGKSAGGQPHYATVYVDGVRRGGPDALRQVVGASVREIRYLSGPEATLRFGIDHEGGAILVTLK